MLVASLWYYSIYIVASYPILFMVRTRLGS
jgi:hypothetical protein